MKKAIITIFFILISNCLWANGETVVCLHGYFRSYKCMIPLSNVLKSEGFDIYLWDYQSRKKTIEQHAEDLVVILNKIAAQKPGKPIHFVTHSLGGVITRAAVSHPHCPHEAQIGKAVLLAPPNRGSCLARKFQGCKPARWILGKRAGSQLLDYSEEQMLGLGHFPETMDVVVIAGSQGSKFLLSGPNDGKLSVAETYLDTEHTHITQYMSHKWIMTSRWTLHFIKEFLVHDHLNMDPFIP